MKMQSRGRRERDGAWVPCGRHQLAPSAFRVCAFSCRAGCAGGPDHERFSRWGLERRSIPPGPPPTGRTRPPRSRRSPGFDHRLLAPISAPAALRGQIQFAADVVVVDPRPPRSADRQIAFDVANPNSPGTGIGDADSAADFLDLDAPRAVLAHQHASGDRAHVEATGTIRHRDVARDVANRQVPGTIVHHDIPDDVLHGQAAGAVVDADVTPRPGDSQTPGSVFNSDRPRPAETQRAGAVAHHNRANVRDRDGSGCVFEINGSVGRNPHCEGNARVVASPPAPRAAPSLRIVRREPAAL